MRPRTIVSILAGLVLGLLPAGAALAQPANDDLANATPVASLPTTDSVDIAGATLEDGEPSDTCAPVHGTVWYAVTLGRKATVTVDTIGSTYDTVLTAFTGTDFSDFTLIACNDDFHDLQSQVTFPVAAGETVFVQVGAFGDDEFGDPGGQLQITFDRARGTQSPVTRSAFRGSSAYSEWFDYGDNGGSDTVAHLTDGRSKTGPGKPAADAHFSLHHWSSEYDEETGEYTVVELSGGATPQDGEYDLDRRLRSAFVDLDLTLQGSRCSVDEDEEWTCTPLTADVTVSVSWEGQGTISTYAARERGSGEGYRFSYTVQGTNRFAVADGSVTGDVVLDLGTSDWANLSRSASSFLSWQRL